MSAIKQGADIKSMGWAAVLAGIGALAIMLGPVFNVVIRYRRITIPSEVISGIGVVIAIIAAFMFKSSLKSDKCADCDKVLENKEAWFSLQDEEQVVEAVENLDGEKLKSLDKSTDSGNSVIVDVDYCPDCKIVGKITVNRKKEFNKETILSERIIKDERFKKIAKVARKHEDKRDDDE